MPRFTRRIAAHPRFAATRGCRAGDACDRRQPFFTPGLRPRVVAGLAPWPFRPAAELSLAARAVLARRRGETRTRPARHRSSIEIDAIPIRRLIKTASRTAAMRPRSRDTCSRRDHDARRAASRDRSERCRGAPGDVVRGALGLAGRRAPPAAHGVLPRSRGRRPGTGSRQGRSRSAAAELGTRLTECDGPEDRDRCRPRYHAPAVDADGGVRYPRAGREGERASRRPSDSDRPSRPRRAEHRGGRPRRSRTGSKCSGTRTSSRRPAPPTTSPGPRRSARSWTSTPSGGRSGASSPSQDALRTTFTVVDEKPAVRLLDASELVLREDEWLPIEDVAG